MHLCIAHVRMEFRNMLLCKVVKKHKSMKFWDINYAPTCISIMQIISRHSL